MPTKSELKYHIVWCTKYRRKVLNESIQNKLKELISEKSEDLGYKIVPEVGQTEENCTTKVVEFYVKAPKGKTKQKR